MNKTQYAALALMAIAGFSLFISWLGSDIDDPILAWNFLANSSIAMEVTTGLIFALGLFIFWQSRRRKH